MGKYVAVHATLEPGALHATIMPQQAAAPQPIIIVAQRGPAPAASIPVKKRATKSQLAARRRQRVADTLKKIGWFVRRWEREARVCHNVGRNYLHGYQTSVQNRRKLEEAYRLAVALKRGRNVDDPVIRAIVLPA